MNSSLEAPPTIPPLPEGAASGGSRRVAQWMAIASSSLIYYDFVLCATLAPFIAMSVFETTDATTAVLQVIGLVAFGYIAMLIGALWLGPRADRFGRRGVLLQAALISAMATTLIGAIPDSDTIGVAAPIIFLALRIVQGIAVGSEFPGLFAYLAETHADRGRGMWTNFAISGVMLGFVAGELVALLVDLALSPAQLDSWGWRLPFLVAPVFGLVTYLARRRLVESPLYLRLRDSGQLSTAPVRDLFREDAAPFAKNFVVTGATATISHLALLFVPVYLITFEKVELSTALLISGIAALLVITLATPAAAWSDRVGRKPLMIAGYAGTMAVAYPAYRLLGADELIDQILGQALLVPFTALMLGPYPAFIAESYPTKYRFTAAALGNAAYAVFVGGNIVAATALAKSYGWQAPAIYLMAGGLAAVVITLFVRDCYRQPLR